MTNFMRRLYLIRPLTGLLLCLPAVGIVIWYSWESYSAFDRYRRAVGSDVTLSEECFQLHLHDALRRDARRISMSSPPSPSKLKTFSLHLSKKNLSLLYDSSSKETQRPYVAAKIEAGSETVEAEVRLRGQQHWHHLGPQKSLKIRLPKGKLLDGYRIFNLINDPAPIVVGESIILDLARAGGVLTPVSSFARLKLNGADLGVFRYETQPDESLLRMSGMVPGSIYSGNLPGSARTSELWQDTRRWRKSAWRIDKEAHDFSELKTLLNNLRTMTVAEFTEFARKQIDLEAFATLDALDVAFGSDQHDFRQNHKLHYDPYKGRWAPVAWNFRAFKNDPQFNITENPILLRLKQVPEYLSLRSRIVYELLVGEGSLSRVRKKGKSLLRRLKKDLASDPFFDAYKLLSPMDSFHRQMVRPMDLKRAALVFESELKTLEQRHTFLLSELKKNPLWSNAVVNEKGHTRFDLIIAGRSGVKLTGFEVAFDVQCAETNFEVLDDGQAIAMGSNSYYFPLLRDRSLYPAVRLVERENKSAKRGDVQSEISPVRYSFDVHGSCAPSSIVTTGIHLATGRTIRSRPAPQNLLGKLPRVTLSPHDVPQFIAGEVSPHPDIMAPPTLEGMELSGLIQVDDSRVFGSHQEVIVLPGTRFEMAAGTSLVFLGQVRFNGSRERPIVIEGAGDAIWGGVAIQGPATKGSSMRHVVIHGGTTPSYEEIPYPGMLNIHNTKNIIVENCRLGRNTVSDDLLHIAYVDDLTLNSCTLTQALSDALDVEFVSGAITDLTVLGAGDDGLDAMGSELRVRETLLVDCKGNGISAGEQSRLKVLDTLVAGAQVGALAKNASEIGLEGVLLMNNQVGVRVYSRTNRYLGQSAINAGVLFVVGSERPYKEDKESKGRVDIGRIQQRLPHNGALNQLLEDVLGLSNWNELEGYLAAIREKGER